MCPCLCALTFKSTHTLFQQSTLVYLEDSAAESINTKAFEKMLSLYSVLAVDTHLKGDYWKSYSCSFKDKEGCNSNILYCSF